MQRRHLWLLVALAALCLLGRAISCSAETPGEQRSTAKEPLPARKDVTFDFTGGKGAAEWTAANHIARLTGSPNGLIIEINGNDPYIHGPARDYPDGQPLWVTLKFKSEQSGMAQLFYYQPPKYASEPDSIRFAARGGRWETVRLPLPPLGKGYRLRFDPPGTGGKVVLASITVSPRILLREPEWLIPVPPVFRADSRKLRAGDLELIHVPDLLGGFAIEVDGERMAVGHARPLIGYLRNGQERWLNFAERGRARAALEGNTLQVEAQAEDADGAIWTIRQKFAPGKQNGALDVETRVSVSQARDVIYLPLLTLLPGVGTFGQEKGQGLFSGLEYLDNEPSSSEADIIGPGSKRQVPDTLKITLPLMAIQAKDRYIALSWEPGPQFSALFDSPDRLFQSGGHLMGLLFPGSDGENRLEGSLLPYDAQRLAARSTLTLRATILGGKGRSVVPAVERYVALRGLPPVPNPGLKFPDYAALAAAGFLDSKIREGDRYRHAYPGSFDPNAVADVPLMLDWLAGETKEARQTQRWQAAARSALKLVGAADLNEANVSHVAYPVAALVYGQAAVGAEKARQRARDLLMQFEPDGSILYRKSPGGLDYGKTHFAPDANGLTAQVVLTLLRAAITGGDADQIQAGLRLLNALDKFDNTVPRGAQTWEVPLHTPDILASAHLVAAYTLGYELTGEDRYLERARYWAWTGVPFVYLIPPTELPVGLYATIPVLGATQWVAPNWMGLPVQWCGLVYSDALYRLARYDAGGPWRQLADGITASGIQQTWPLKSDPERVGLLPDSYTLRAEVRNDAAINPGTLLMNAIRYYHRPEIYDYRVFRKAGGVIVHAPGAIAAAQESENRIAFTVQGWPKTPYQILIVGLKQKPNVRLNGQPIALTAPQIYQPELGRLILEVSGQPQVEITF